MRIQRAVSVAEENGAVINYIIFKINEEVEKKLNSKSKVRERTEIFEAWCSCHGDLLQVGRFEY